MIDMEPAAEDAYNAYIFGRRQLTTDEAIAIWDARARLMREHESLHKLFFMAEVLASETARGDRCAVCGRYRNDSCSWEC
jgi:hypothetical protein